MSRGRFFMRALYGLNAGKFDTAHFFKLSRYPLAVRFAFYRAV